MADPLKDILKMTLQEKIDVVETIWNSIDENSLPVTEDELTVAKERYAEYLKNPDDVVSWEKAKKALMEKYGF
jgi:putative addiction module component (TIGR02574 family)